MNSKDILKDLISFNTIKDKDNKEILDYIENYLKKYGFKTEYRSKCLIMSNREECSIGFLGHTDTVTDSSDWTMDPFKLVETDNKLYGLGSCDMKGGIAAILSIIPKIDKGIKLFFTYDEEIGFSGIKELIDKKIEFPDTMIIGEPTENKIINSSKGLLEFKINFKGVSCHSSNPSEGINAIEKCLDFITELKKYYKELEREKYNSRSLTMNIGVINGGNSINIVPNNCEVLIDFRTMTKDQNVNIIKKVEELLEKYNGTYEIINKIDPFMSDKNNVKLSDFITEASFLDSKNRYILGAGPNNAHKADEYITVDSLEELERQYLDIIKMI